MARATAPREPTGSRGQALSSWRLWCELPVLQEGAADDADERTCACAEWQDETERHSWTLGRETAAQVTEDEDAAARTAGAAMLAPPALGEGAGRGGCRRARSSRSR